MQTKLGDRVLLTTVSILLVIGLVMIASAGVIYSETRFADEYYFFKHQLFFGVFPGVIALYLFPSWIIIFGKRLQFQCFLFR